MGDRHPPADPPQGTVPGFSFYDVEQDVYWVWDGKRWESDDYPVGERPQAINPHDAP
jgi:hypothetical protein